MAQIKAVNNPTTIKFTLSSSQTGAATVRKAQVSNPIQSFADLRVCLAPHWLYLGYFDLTTLMLRSGWLTTSLAFSSLRWWPSSSHGQLLARPGSWCSCRRELHD